MGKLFNEPFLHGRGLDARPGNMGGGAIEINTVPRFDAMDSSGVVYSKIPALHFPVDDQGRTLLVQDVTYYSKAALADAFRAWRDGGPVCGGKFNSHGVLSPRLSTHSTTYAQAGKKIEAVESVVTTKVFEGNVWGLQWSAESGDQRGLFPQYFKEVGGKRIVVGPKEVPAQTGLLDQTFRAAEKGDPYVSPKSPAWTRPGPTGGSFTAKLVDGSTVTYAWYRFVDQPSFQQYQWPAEKKQRLQELVEKIHAHWQIDGQYMAPPGRGQLVSLDPALIVTPPKGLEVGYVPIVIGQSAD